MTVLNPGLYSLLRSTFGDVKVANQGEGLMGDYKFDPINNKLVLEVDTWGEAYRVNCPFCYESRNRLYINHRYGTFDEVANSYNTHMVRCFNEECPKRDPNLFKDLYDRIFGLRNINQRHQTGYLRGRITEDSGKLVEAPPPGEIDLFCDLPDNHKAITYLASRGYDVNALMSRWNLMYCRSAAPRYKMAHDRIIIPIFQESMCVGWQARYIGDIDWKVHGIPKSYTLPHMPKRMILYNHDVAFQQDMVIVTEGPTSCWSVWPYGVALLGKQATVQQLRLIVTKAAEKDKPIVILLDGDATYEANKLYRNLQPHAKAGILKCVLPEDKDPGDYVRNTEELWKLIYQQAEDNNIVLPVRK